MSGHKNIGGFVSESLKAVVLDAMGVIYSIADDLRDLFCPFIAEKGGSRDARKAEELYLVASLGNMPASEFWKTVDVAPELEDEYLQLHGLTDGLLDFLKEIKRRGHEVWCLSNDLPEWSKKLRLRFGLDKYITGFVISSDVGFRKPDPPIFHQLTTQLRRDPHDVIFVDDNQKNLVQLRFWDLKPFYSGLLPQTQWVLFTKWR